MAGRMNILLFSLLALFWSGSYIGIKITVEQLPPIFCAMVRVAVALFFLTLLFLAMRKELSVPLHMVWRLWLAAWFVQAIPFALLFYGERFVAPALASILNSTVPIWVLGLNLLIFRDTGQITLVKIVGLLIGIAGVTYIFWPMLAHDSHTTVVGLLSILLMAVSYAIGAIVNQRLTVGMASHFYANLWQQHIASLVLLLILSLSMEHWPTLTAFNSKEVLAFLYLGIFSTAIAWIIYYHLLRVWDAVRASSVTYVVPLLAISWDILLLHLTPGINELIGALLILLGVTLIQLQRKSAWSIK
jgi:drug/metabolite transporter (DMT)-like permease